MAGVHFVERALDYRPVTRTAEAAAAGLVLGILARRLVGTAAGQERTSGRGPSVPALVYHGFRQFLDRSIFAVVGNEL